MYSVVMLYTVADTGSSVTYRQRACRLALSTTLSGPVCLPLILSFGRGGES